MKANTTTTATAKTLVAVRKPIYILHIEASAIDFRSALEVFKAYKTRLKFEEADRLQYDYNFSAVDNLWLLHIYRDVAIDFIEK